MSEAVSGVSQTDYMKLFMQELTYQDPLKPIDNREFMAQMAQFTALQEAQQSTEYIGRLLGTTIGNQSLMLLGKHVKFADSSEPFEVKGVSFAGEGGAKLILASKGQSITRKLDDIIEASL
ncbi:flagellar hook assembly protein FlgD [Legionella sp. CNM-4043-24]|uniref:flagellar hook assembly protein FlgD n=1 Tax=Legionella sp. CNM-4043-24 TaxID=3421646 RepID=UPI00403B2EDF